ncbi:MOSC domain-containing protein [Neolewinella sp.]|uniref:MOSC domain-containing protein n=1 Tax=Neolewinella sp. TaxID=2993543 RepID=UPI003B520302
MLTVSQLYIYPIKSLGGIAVDSAEVTDRGLAHDRRYLLVTPDEVFITLRKYPRMALLQPELRGGALSVRNTETGEVLRLPEPADGPTDREVVIWQQTVAARSVSAAADTWFSDALGMACHLVYMPDHSHRPVAPSSGLRPAGKIASFADAYPFLLIGEASLADLNARYGGEVHFGMERFRPNIVCSGGAPYAEDDLTDFTINGISFTGLEPCARCGVPNVDPATGVANRVGEPLATLAGYRRVGGKVYFGMNLVHAGTGSIAVGDLILP